MRVKICGITRLEQGTAIASFGASALGFICVKQSPRYITSNSIKAIVEHLPTVVSKIGVFVNADALEIKEVVTTCGLTGVQLHGEESIEFCQQLREFLPEVEIIKALRIKTPESISLANLYSNYVDTLLLDAYHPQLHGGTGKTINWDTITNFRPSIPWLLAGGLTPDNILQALELLNPDGIDLSSGVEISPGEKDLDKVALLFEQLKNANR